MKFKQCRISAFSLAEVVAVVAVMAVVLAVAQPRFATAIENDRVRRAATRLAVDIRLAQSEAIQQQDTVRVLFAPVADAYRIEQLSTAADGTTSIEVYLGADADYRTAIAAADFGGRNGFSFDRYGVPNAGGTVTLGSRRLRSTVTVDAGTGQVTISELSRNAVALDPPARDVPADVEFAPLVVELLK